MNGDRTFFPTGFDSHCGRLWVRNFGNSVNRSLPVSFGWDTKSRWSLLSGVYARGSKRSHQSALECVTVVDSTSHSKSPNVRLCGARHCPAQYWEEEEEAGSNLLRGSISATTGSRVCPKAWNTRHGHQCMRVKGSHELDYCLIMSDNIWQRMKRH